MAEKKITKKTTTAKKTTTTKKNTATKKVTSVAKKTSKVVFEKPEEKINAEEIEIVTVKEEPVVKKEPVTTVPKKKMKIKLSKLLFFISILVVLIFCVIFAIKLFTKKPSYKDKASYSESFFIRSKEGKYALFSDKGKKYTKFVYENAGRFISNHTVVQNSKSEYAIIDSEGKETVKFGTYNYITDYSGLYKVRSDKGYALIKNNGKVLLDSEKLDVISYGVDYPIIIAGTEDKFYVYMYDGTEIAVFNKKSNVKDPTVNYIENYATVFYNKKNIVIDLRNKKEKLSFESNVHYCVNAATENCKILSYNACASWFETLSESGHKISNGKNEIDLSNKCDQLYVYDNTIICSKDYNKYFVSVKKDSAKLSKKLSSTIAFVDDENYAYKDNDTYKIVFIKNGKKVKTMDASLSSVSKLNEKAYVLYVDGAYEFYDLSGKKLYNKSYKIAYPFDENGLAKVSTDGTNKFLINYKGKKVSSEYQEIKNEGEFYVTYDKGSNKGIIDKKGKVILDTKYENILIKTFRDKYYAVLTKNDKYTVYNLSKNKEILTTKDTVSLNEHYIKTSGNKAKYYTYNNKLIYTE